MTEEMDNRITHMIDENGGMGSVTIPDEAFCMIACMAALEAEGVYAVDGNITKEKAAKLSYSNVSGVKVEVEEKNVAVYISLRIYINTTIPEVIKKSQEKIKSAIESMTGYTVTSVNIKISDIYNGEAK